MCFCLGFIYWNLITMHGPMNIKFVKYSCTCGLKIFSLIIEYYVEGGMAIV